MTTVSTKTVITRQGRVSYGVTGDGPAMVILHSLLTDRKAFDPVIPDLPGRIVTLDLPGFGTSDHALPTIEAFADLMAAAVDEICAEDDPPTVVGNGLGSFVSLAMAIGHPEVVGRLVLVGTGATFPEEARPAFGNMADLVASEGMTAVTPVALRRIYTGDYLAGHPDEAEERASVLANTDPEAFITACRALQHLDLTEGVGEITVPTLIVVGEDDQATPPEMAAGLHELLADSRKIVLPGVAHAPQLQDPAGFIKAIEPFLEEGK